MENEINIDEVLKSMRERIGALAQENAILQARLNKITNDTTA
jgi:hypothetical protein